ncbi:hypothetical protein TELCIR_10420 [Teladorsagia circumcincta]|uniref:Cullin N-terminal domain-containing protein n=1 Tax=Teladorsagia circumcincta TaxID=45464 RepID=A0A2G9UC59_TELCI|nr:hypothetical protein TELCIR_10420 [Teladorsagia circumcincta]
MTVYESAGFYVDQMLSLTTVTVQSALFTLASMTVVCAIFMGNFCSTVTAAASMASISIGVIGFMSLFHFDLDPVVMVSLLMSIGMSVDYIAHVAYHLQLDTKSKISHGSVVRTPISGMVKKVENTVECVALPLAQSGLSTITCVLPLLFLPTVMAVSGSRRQNMTIDGVWEDLYKGLQAVYLREVMKSQRYMELYTSVYDFCTAVSVNSNPGVVGRPTRSGARSSHKNFSGEDGPVTGTDFVGVEMYAKLTNFIESYVKARLEGARDLLGEDLLRYYTTQWSEFRFSSKV